MSEWSLGKLYLVSKPETFLRKTSIRMLFFEFPRLFRISPIYHPYSEKSRKFKKGHLLQATARFKYHMGENMTKSTLLKVAGITEMCHFLRISGQQTL